MKKPHFVFLAILALVLVESALAQPKWEKPVKHRLSYDISVERIGTGEVVEFTPINVRWKLTVKKLVGVVGPEPTPVDVSICPVIIDPASQFQCPLISKAAPGRNYQGTITVPAPPAGIQSPLRIVVLKPVNTVEDYGQRTVVGETEVKVDVAAQYDLSLTQFEVLTTRSTTNDTVWLTLMGLIKSNPRHISDGDKACKLVGFNWCVFNQGYGDVQNGVHQVKNLRIGPYKLIPEREEDLRMLFWLENRGENPTQEVGEEVANIFSTLGMIALSSYGGASGQNGLGSSATQIDNGMQKLHSKMFASCDGKLAADIVFITNRTEDNQPQNTLAAFTRETGVYTETLRDIYQEKDEDVICGKRFSKYKITYTIYRTSWKSWGFQPRW